MAKALLALVLGVLGMIEFILRLAFACTIIPWFLGDISIKELLTPMLWDILKADLNKS